MTDKSWLSAGLFWCLLVCIVLLSLRIKYIESRLDQIEAQQISAEKEGE